MLIGEKKILFIFIIEKFRMIRCLDRFFENFVILFYEGCLLLKLKDYFLICLSEMNKEIEMKL